MTDAEDDGHSSFTAVSSPPPKSLLQRFDEDFMTPIFGGPEVCFYTFTMIAVRYVCNKYPSCYVRR